MADEPLAEPHAALAVLHDLAPRPRARWPVVLLAVAMIMLSLTLLRVAMVASDNSQAVRANQEAVRVSCTLLANAISQSGTATNSPAATPSPQEQLTALYIGIIVRSMTADDLRKFRALSNEVAKQGNGVDFPDCRKVSMHPNSVTVATAP